MKGKQESEAAKTPQAKEKAKPVPQPKDQPKKSLGNIIRVVETNIDGGKPVRVAIRRIPGISFMLSNAIATVSGLGDKKVEALSQEEMKKLIDVIQNPEKYSIPVWMLNRRRDPIKGTDRHIVASSLDFLKRMDINEMKKLRTYKGVRHSFGLPVRGQRTRNTSRTGSTIGVKREKQAPAKAAAPKKE